MCDFVDEQDRPLLLEGDNIAPGTGIDLEIESESEPQSTFYIFVLFLEN